MQSVLAKGSHAWARVPCAGSEPGVNETAFFRRVVEASATPIAVLQCKGEDQPLVYVNPAFERCFGSACEDIVGCDWRTFFHAESNAAELDRAGAAIKAGQEVRLALRRRANDGNTIWHELHVGAADGGNGPHDQRVASLRDITAERSSMEELKRRACFDALTGLPNRYVLRDRLRQALAHARRTGEVFAVALVDIDSFKHVNDTLGHHVGDELLRRIAGRLTRPLRQSDTVARLGGDEFVVILNPVDSGESVQQVVSRLAHELRQPLRIDGHVLIVSCSIGVGVYPEHGLDEAALLRHADRAMYEAKPANRRFSKPIQARHQQPGAALRESRRCAGNPTIADQSGFSRFPDR